MDVAGNLWTLGLVGALRTYLLARRVLSLANHALLHYGKFITYMRLRGKVPPSTEP